VAEGRGGPRPWDQLTGQIYLGSEAFVAQHQPNRVIRGIPRRQTQAQRPSLRVLFQRNGPPTRIIHTAYRQYGYRLAEIADHLGVHAATVSRRLKQAEQSDV
jgi:transcriptional regulator with PAS, ATPase and Fis domain